MKKYLFLLSLLACALLLFAGGKPEEGDRTLIYGKGSPAIALDPALVDEGGSSEVANRIFETLLDYEPGTTKIVPELAESYTISEDGKEIVFKLRKDVKFHDGTTMDADAVVFSLNRQHDRNHPFHQYGPWKQWSSSALGDAYNDDGTLKRKGIIDQITKVDDSTVRVTLNQVEAPIFIHFTSYYTAIVSPTAVKKFQGDFKKHPVGTGPFRFVEWVKDDHVTMERFDDYWGKKPRLQRVVMKVYPDETARTLALIKGEVDFIMAPDYDNLMKLKKDPNVNVMMQSGLTIGYLCMNVERKPFDNILVRKAINHAVNKKEIIDAVYGVLGEPGVLPMPKSLWAYNDKIKDYEYNTQKARDLLAEAGYQNGFSCELFALPVSRPYNPNGRKVAEILQAQLKEVGIDAEIVTYDIGTYWDKVDAGEFDICMTGWSGTADPDNYTFKLFSKGYLNSSRWYHDEYIDLVTKAKQTMDQKQRTKYYLKAQEILYEEAPIVMLAHGVLAYPMRKNVKGFIPSPLDNLEFEYMYLEQ